MTRDPEADLGADLATTAEISRLDIGPSLATRVIAELVGTFVLVLVGMGAAVTAVGGNGGMTIIVGAAFGVAVLVLIVAMGAISGAHLNPAVTVGLWTAGRFCGRDIAPYVLAQTVGAIAAGGVLRLLVDLVPDGPGGRDGMDPLSIGWGDHSAWGVSLWVALLAEFLLTAALMATILAATSAKAPAGQAQYTIALAITLLVIIGIPLTNAALNPARATGTALFSNTWAMTQLWAWWLAPVAGGAAVGLLHRLFGPVEDLEAHASSDAHAA